MRCLELLHIVTCIRLVLVKMSPSARCITARTWTVCNALFIQHWISLGKWLTLCTVHAGWPAPEISLGVAPVAASQTVPVAVSPAPGSQADAAQQGKAKVG